MAPALAPKALERAGVHPVGCAFLPIFSPLAVLSLVSTYCSPHATASRCAVAKGSLSQTGPAIMGAGVARSAPVHLSPPMASLPGVILGAGWAVAMYCPGQGGYQFGNLVPQFHGTLPRVCGHSSPSPYFIMGFLILTPCLVGGISSTGNKWSWGCYRYTLWNLWCVCGPHGRDGLWGAVGPLDLSLSQGTAT